MGLLPVNCPLPLHAVLENPRVRLDLVQGYPFLGIKDEKLLIRWSAMIQNFPTRTKWVV